MSENKMTCSLPFSPEEYREMQTLQLSMFDAIYAEIGRAHELANARRVLSIHELKTLIGIVWRNSEAYFQAKDKAHG